jgi:outer membrane receptor protein involved in Fe transport
MGALTVNGKLGAVDAVSATSLVHQQVNAVFDASAAAPDFGLNGTARYQDDQKYSVFNQELRLSQSRDDGLSWIAGLSWMKAETVFNGTLEPSSQPSLGVVAIHQETTELAGFAELAVPLDSQWTVTAGGRLFRSTARNERRARVMTDFDRRKKTGVTPSLGLSWSPAVGQLYFMRLASALRPGGLSPSGISGQNRFSSDELKNIDLGWRIKPGEGTVSWQGGFYLTRWEHIQSDYLLANGLIATHNAGEGRIYGVESAIHWQPGTRWLIDTGITLQKARLERAESPDVIIDDARLPIVPDISLRLGITWQFNLGGWDGKLSALGNYIGPSRLSFDRGLDRKMGEYTLVGVTASLSKWGCSFAIRADNILHSEGDSFALGNPFSLRSGQQYTPLRPRTFTLSVSRNW